MAHASFDTELSKVIERLWSLDTNGCQSGKDYSINLQNRARGHADNSQSRLFSSFDQRILDRPTYRDFVALLDNYDPDTGREEIETEQEKDEEKRFLNSIIDTEVMRKAHEFLVRKRKSPESKVAFASQLYDIWFKLYRRTTSDRVLNSCGFEHVFLGEIRHNEVLGFHNWITLYIRERNDDLNYYGYLSHHKSGNGRLEILTHRFEWRKVLKPRTSTFLGTSPELEMAMYTLAFLCKPQYGEVNVKIYDVQVELKIYDHGRGIGSAYPVYPID